MLQGLGQQRLQARGRHYGRGGQAGQKVAQHRFAGGPGPSGVRVQRLHIATHEELCQLLDLRPGPSGRVSVFAMVAPANAEPWTLGFRLRLTLNFSGLGFRVQIWRLQHQPGTGRLRGA